MCFSESLEEALRQSQKRQEDERLRRGFSISGAGARFVQVGKHGGLWTEKNGAGE